MRGLGFLQRFRKGGQTADQHASIPTLASVDMEGIRHDGGVDLITVASGPLTAVPDILMLLRSKVEAYLERINSEEFRRAYNDPPAEKTTIVVVCTGSVDPEVVEYVEKMEAWVVENNARIRLEERAV